MRLALLFPGQGVQHPGMLPWLDGDPAAASVLSKMASRLGTDWRERLADPAWASANTNAQCLMTGTSLAAWHALRAQLPRPVAIAGYSVGELAAFSAAEVFDADQALAIASLRAEAMDSAARAAPGSLMSVIGPSSGAIEALCHEHGVEVAIRIAVDRVVLGGPVEALDAAEAALGAAHADVTRLPVRVASHTSAMNLAAGAIAERLVGMTWRAPSTALVVGRDGSAVRPVDGLKRALAEQTAHTVEWERAMQTLVERRPDRVLEVGAGSSLSRIWRAAWPAIDARSTDEFGSAAAVVRWATKA